LDTDTRHAPRDINHAHWLYFHVMDLPCLPLPGPPHNMPLTPLHLPPIGSRTHRLCSEPRGTRTEHPSVTVPVRACPLHHHHIHLTPGYAPLHTRSPGHAAQTLFAFTGPTCLHAVSLALHTANWTLALIQTPFPGRSALRPRCARGGSASAWASPSSAVRRWPRPASYGHGLPHTGTIWVQTSSVNWLPSSATSNATTTPLTTFRSCRPHLRTGPHLTGYLGARYRADAVNTTYPAPQYHADA